MTTHLSARECLAAITVRYKALESYADEGFVRPMGLLGLKSCWFETQFVRPGMFRFRFSTPHPYRPLRHIVTTTVIGSDGLTPYFFLEHPRSAPTLRIEKNLGMAVAAATGISQGTARTIGSLLLEDVGGFALQQLKRPRFRQARQFEGEWCGRISGIHPRGGRITIWFGMHDLLVRKYVRHEFKQEEVRTKIRVDMELENALFKVPQVQA